MIIHDLKLDMIPNMSKNEVWVNQYDTDFLIRITLFASKGTFSVETGTTAAIRGTKPDGNGYSADASVNGNVITVTGAEQMTVVAGRSVYELTLYKDGKKLSTVNFNLRVERAALDMDTPTSRSQTRELVSIEEHADEIIAAVDNMSQYAGDAEAYAKGTRGGVDVESTDPAYQNNAKYWAEHASGENLAPQFSASAAYAAGDYVLYDNHLYRFSSAHAAGAWVGTDAVAVTAGSEISDLKDDLNQISEVVGFGTIETYDYVPIALDIDSRTSTQNGVIFTQNADGSVYVNGINTSNSENVYSIKNASGRTLASLVAGEKYLLSGCPSGGSASTYRLGLKLDSGGNFVCTDTGNGAIANITESGNYRVYISVGPGATVDHTFKPVIAEQVVTGQITDDILSAKDTVARESLSEDYVEDAGYIYNLGDYFRTDNGFINIDGTNSPSGHYYKTRAIRNITDELKHINTRINKHWNENNYILSNFVNDIETINILDLELVEDEFWGNGGIKSYTNEVEKYYRVKNLIDVTPEEIIALINFGHAQSDNPNITICGCYDENGNDLPGAVRLSSEYVIDYDLDGGSLHYVVFRVPDGCYKLGLHFKSFINNQGEFEPFSFSPRMVRKNKEESLADYSLMLNTAFIVAGTVNYEPELHRITFDNVYFGPLESNDSFAYGHYNRYQGTSMVVDWSDSLEENFRFAKHILYNSETRTLHWYDRINDDPDGLTEQIANDRKHWFLVCICYKNYVDIPTGFTDAVINVNGVNINHIKNQYSLTDAMYLKGLSKKNLGKVPTILCAGQSNAVGVTPKTQLPSYVTFPIQNAGICKAGSDTFAPLTYENYTSANNKWGFDLIAYHYISADGNTFNVIKHAMGATSIDTSGDSLYHWTPNYEELDTIEHSLLYTLESLTRACVENNNIDVKAIIWHQGEGDDGARFPTAAKNYYKNFLSMIAYMRGFVGNPYLPFICGTVSQKSGQYDASVDAAIRRAAQDDPNIYLVDMKNATLLDSYHFSSTWCEYFGKKVHDYLIDAKVFSGTKLNPSEPT